MTFVKSSQGFEVVLVVQSEEEEQEEMGAAVLLVLFSSCAIRLGQMGEEKAHIHGAQVGPTT